ncbi:hypothetical protein AB0I84_35170 [Streptomyces spectabilis]|uniref:hypothetical protein n=1 Tax=Streptomyces spectabilis TaxID=68270 RepID=UPI0033E4B3FF
MTDPSNGELWRLMQQISARLDRFAAPDVYAYQHQQLVNEIAELRAELAAEKAAAEEKARRAEEERKALELRRQQDRRMVFTALIAPVLLLFLQLYLTARGAGA